MAKPKNAPSEPLVPAAPREAYNEYWGEYSAVGEVPFSPKTSIMVATWFYDGPIRNLLGRSGGTVEESLEAALRRAFSSWMKEQMAQASPASKAECARVEQLVPRPDGGVMRKIMFKVDEGATKDWSRIVAKRFGTRPRATRLFLRELVLLALAKQRDALKRGPRTDSAAVPQPPPTALSGQAKL